MSSLELAEFQRAVSINRQYAGAYYQLALCLRAKSDKIGAKKALRQALVANPRWAQAHHILGQYLREEKDLEGAIVEFSAAVDAAPRRSADDDRRRLSPTVAVLRGHVRQLIESAADEIDELHLGDGTQPHHRGPDGRADDRRFGDRGVDHPLLAEPLEETVGDLERAAVDADVLAEEEHPVVRFHFLPEALADRLEVRRRAPSGRGAHWRNFATSRVALSFTPVYRSRTA